ESLPTVLHQPDARAGARSAGGEHGAPVDERVARAHRIRPANIVEPGRAQALAAIEVAVAHQAHADRAGVPAAGDQAAEKARLGGRRIDVERLRIEAPAEID